MTNREQTPLLVITGPVGVGKTTVAQAISDLLRDAGVCHAVADLDWLRCCYPSQTDDPFHTALGLHNLAAIWIHYRAAGAQRLIIVDIVETRATLDAYRVAVPGASCTVVRLHASLPTIRTRLAAREAGASLRWHRRRAAELLSHWQRAPVEDLRIETEGQRPLEIARDILSKTWREIAGQLQRDEQR